MLNQCYCDARLGCASCVVDVVCSSQCYCDARLGCVSCVVGVVCSISVIVMHVLAVYPVL